jgi:hypothetical protein
MLIDEAIDQYDIDMNQFEEGIRHIDARRMKRI